MLTGIISGHVIINQGCNLYSMQHLKLINNSSTTCIYREPFTEITCLVFHITLPMLSNELYSPMNLFCTWISLSDFFRRFSKKQFFCFQSEIHSSHNSLCQIRKSVSNLTYMGQGDQAHGFRPQLFLTYVSSLKPLSVKLGLMKA